MGVEIILILFIPLAIALVFAIHNYLKHTSANRNIRKFKKRIMKKLASECRNDNFEEIYNQIIEGLDIFKMRKMSIKDKICSTFLCIAFVADIVIIIILNLFSHIHNWNFNEGGLYLLMFLAVLIPIIVMIVSENYSNSYGYLARKSLKKLLLIINPNFSFNYDGKVESYAEVINELYVEAGFNDSFDKSGFTNYLEYELNTDTKIKMANIGLMRRIQGNRYYRDFLGICAKISREINVENEILISKSKLIKSDDYIKSNYEFDKYFDLISSDKKYAETRINKEIQAEILRLYKEYGIMFEISLKDKDIYIRFFTGDLFDVYSVVKKNELHRDYLIFNSVLKIIERLNNIL